jgi:hypothetical protein
MDSGCRQNDGLMAFAFGLGPPVSECLHYRCRGIFVRRRLFRVPIRAGCFSMSSRAQWKMVLDGCAVVGYAQAQDKTGFFANGTIVLTFAGFAEGCRETFSTFTRQPQDSLRFQDLQVGQSTDNLGKSHQSPIFGAGQS